MIRTQVRAVSVGSPAAAATMSVSEVLRIAAASAFERWYGVFEQVLARTRAAEAAAVQSRVLLSAIEGALLLDRAAQSTTHLRALPAAVPVLLGDRTPGPPGLGDRTPGPPGSGRGLPT